MPVGCLSSSGHRAQKFLYETVVHQTAHENEHSNSTNIATCPWPAATPRRAPVSYLFVSRVKAFRHRVAIPSAIRASGALDAIFQTHLDREIGHPPSGLPPTKRSSHRPPSTRHREKNPRFASPRRIPHRWRGTASESPPMGWFFQSLLSALFLLSIVLSIPIAFDVGGRDSGLAYSLALFAYYFIYSTVRAVTASSTRTGRAIGAAFRLSQWVVIPALLIWALGRFAVDAGSTNWVERTFDHLAASKTTSWSEWAGNVIETITLGGWDKTLRYSSPVFQLLEGFCTLLVIQASGQITRWLVNSGRSDTWMVSWRTPHLSRSRSGFSTRSVALQALSWRET